MKNICQKRSKQRTGRFGENLAVNFLTENNYSIIDTNFYTRFGEIDIIAKEKATNQLIFIEVKTRLNTQYGLPEESVGRSKIKRLQKTAHCFCEYNDINDENYRFDVISVLVNKNKGTALIRHIKSVGL